MPTSAQKYLIELLEQYPVREIQEDRLRVVMEEMGIGQKFVNDSLRNRVAHLMDQLRETLPAPIQTLLLSGKLVAGEIGVATPNAHMIPVVEDQFVVVLHTGLFEFLYRIARPLASAVFRVQRSENTGINDPELARVVAEIFWWLQATGENFGPDYPVTTDQKQLANLLAMRAERFLLAHELGHVWLAISTPKVLNDTEEESAADIAGLSFSMHACMLAKNETDPTWRMFTYAGAELALQIWNVMSLLNLKFVHGVHPPSAERIVALRSALRTFCDSDEVYNDVAMIALVIERAFNEVRNIINQPGAHAAMFETQAALLADELKELLDDCSGDIVPDYTRFYEDAPRIFSRGYPETILIKVFDDVVKGMKIMISKYQENTEMDGDLKLLRQFKLLFGLTEHMPEPAKSVFSKYLRQ